MRAVNIEWDIDLNDVLDTLENIGIYRAAEVLAIPAVAYAQMNWEERKGAVKRIYDEDISWFNNLMNLPNEVDIDDGEVETEAEAADLLCEEYGFCVRSLNID